MKLLDALNANGFHSSIATSFSCDLSFYSSVIQPRLRGTGCRNNFLLVDAGSYSRSTPLSSALSADAGRRYLVAPARVGGVFHPKLFLLVGKDKGRLLIGSANISSRGYGDNRELTAVLNCGPEESPEQMIIAKAYDYVCSFLDRRAMSVGYKLNRIESDAPWLRTATRKEGPYPIEDRDHNVDLLLSPGTRIMERFRNLVDGDEILHLIVSSPFWDPNLKALSELIQLLQPARTSILIHPRTVNFPINALPKVPGLTEIFNAGILGGSDGRYLHAKLIVAEGRRADHVLAGSANCSIAALGLGDTPPVNAEACLYYRIPRGEAAKALSLSESLLSTEALTDQDLRDLPPYREDERPAEGLPLPGTIEVIERRIYWLPPARMNPTGASLILMNASGECVGDPLPFDSTTEPPSIGISLASYPAIHFASISFPDGGRTAPTILHFHEDLRRAAPSPARERMQNLLEHIRLDETDLKSLLTPFEHLIFAKQEQENVPGENPGRKDPGRAGKEEGEDAGRRLTYEEFIKRQIEPSTGIKNLVVTVGDDAALLVEFLMPLFRRPPPSISELENEEASEEDLEQGGGYGEDEPDPPRDILLLPIPGAELERARKRILRLVDRYAKWCRGIHLDNRRNLDTDEVSRLWALLALLSFLAGRRIVLETGSEERVIPANDPTSSFNFPQLICDVLGDFITAGDRPLINRLRLPDDIESLPDEYFGAWTTSCWAVCIAMELAVRERWISLKEDLEVLGYTLYRQTGIAAGALDESALLEGMKCLHKQARMEFLTTLAQAIKRHMWFLDLARNASPPMGWTPQMLQAGTTNIRLGDRIWTNVVGPRYVRNVVEGTKLYLNRPGSKLKNGATNWYVINAGFAVKMNNINRQIPV